MSRKLIFFFSYRMDLAMDQAILSTHHMIHFGVGFDIFKVITNSTTLTPIPIEAILDSIKPIL